MILLPHLMLSDGGAFQTANLQMLLYSLPCWLIEFSRYWMSSTQIHLSIFHVLAKHIVLNATWKATLCLALYSWTRLSLRSTYRTLSSKNAQLEAMRASSSVKLWLRTFAKPTSLLCHLSTNGSFNGGDGMITHDQDIFSHKDVRSRLAADKFTNIH